MSKSYLICFNSPKVLFSGNPLSIIEHSMTLDAGVAPVPTWRIVCTALNRIRALN